MSEASQGKMDVAVGGGLLRHQSGVRVARDVLRIEIEALAKVSQGLDDAAIDAAIDLLIACAGRIVCTGMGKSGIIGKKIAATLASTGSPAFFVHPGEAGHGDLGMIVDGDVVMALSYSGETAEILALLPSIRRKRVGLVALVGEVASNLGRAADVVLHVGVDEEACPLGLAPTASTTAALAVGDALAMGLVKERGFQADDFAEFHPRGRLGQRILRVRHVMTTGDQVPTVSQSARLPEIVEEMSDKGLGMTAVVNDEQAVIGVITDGDLRRLLQRGEATEAATAAEFMSHAPSHVRADALATEALRHLEEGKITSLLVIDETSRLVGVVHLHDLWGTQMI